MRLTTILASLTFASSEVSLEGIDPWKDKEIAIKRLNEFQREYRANLNLDPDNLVSDLGKTQKWQMTILKKSIEISRKMILDYQKRADYYGSVNIPMSCHGTQELKPPKSTVGEKFFQTSNCDEFVFAKELADNMIAWSNTFNTCAHKFHDDTWKIKHPGVHQRIIKRIRKIIDKLATKLNCVWISFYHFIIKLTSVCFYFFQKVGH